ncbi:MAG: N-acetyltransferase family protein [Paracoccaceae bacterium]
MIIRQARPDDVDAICTIWNDMIRDTLITFTTDLKTNEGVAADIIARGTRFLVAEHEGQVLGFATYGPFRPGPGYRYTAEHSIQLAKDARGQGIGRQLLQRLEAVAIDHDIHTLVAGISSAAPESMAFHAAMGFVETARLPAVGFKADQWLDLILMQKRLRAMPDTAPATG